jgi:(1->4)-alpha-D-glucan 1-alpha-D-glucosylmutase
MTRSSCAGVPGSLPGETSAATNGGNVAAGRVPDSTYRLQLTPEFGFAEAARAAEYLADLGVSHVYLSPVLEAVPGSRHGYDVTDHSRIRAELGGAQGFRAMAKRLRALGLRVILDVVPNHMAVPDNLALNRQLWSVLRDGRASPHAAWFDIDWAQDSRMLLPILGSAVEDSLGDLRVASDGGPDGEPVLRYFDHLLPLRPGTERLPVRDLLDSQHYRLAYWRDAAAGLNWRRFFDVTTLIGIRVEDLAVFDATHEVIVGLVAEGLVDGLRIDHPDGLADPRGYLRRLEAATSGAWIVVEKILEGDEALPSDWPCAGTTGYDALKIVDGLFLDPGGADALTAQYTRFCRDAGDDSAASEFTGVAVAAKRQTASLMFRAELARLVRLLGGACPDAAPDDVLAVLTEMFASFPVYRAYAHPGEPPSAAARSAVGVAVDAARQRLPRRSHGLAADIGAAVLNTAVLNTGVLNTGALNTGTLPGGADGGSSELVVRFQQTTGPVLAKGVEDTAFYRWSRLLALNEVGGDPDRFGVSPRDFHAAAGRLAGTWPTTMTTLSTHDTKRDEDVRARLAVLAEIPEQWGEQVREWHERAAASSSGGTRVDPDTEYLLWQTLVGAWPISGERLDAYLTKAIREAKRQTSWTDGDPEYEAAVLGLAARVLADAELSQSIDGFVAAIAADAQANSLGAKLVQLTMTGVPDVYQGCELAGLSLVDPDNRRGVDFSRRRSMLAALDADFEEAGPHQAPGSPDRAAAAVARLDAAKLLVTARTLRLRRARAEWFAGDYAPVTATGPAAGHVVAFSRGGQAITVATRLPAGLRGGDGWGQTAIELPAGAWTDLLSGALYDGGTVPLAELTRRLPVALLIQEDLLVQDVPAVEEALAEEQLLIEETPPPQEAPLVQQAPPAEEPPLVEEAR